MYEELGTCDTVQITPHEYDPIYCKNWKPLLDKNTHFSDGTPVEVYEEFVINDTR